YVPLSSCVGNVIRNVRLASSVGVPAGFGVIVIFGLRISDQEFSLPTLPVTVSVTSSRHSPLLFNRPPTASKAVRDWDGRKRPENGAVPAEIEVVASSSRIVLLKLS